MSASYYIGTVDVTLSMRHLLHASLYRTKASRPSASIKLLEINLEFLHPKLWIGARYWNLIKRPSHLRLHERDAKLST